MINARSPTVNWSRLHSNVLSESKVGWSPYWSRLQNNVLSESKVGCNFYVLIDRKVEIGA